MQHALKAEATLPGARVVSVPCIEDLELQTDDYNEYVLPSSCTTEIAMEDGVTGLCYKYYSNLVVVDRFGFSAPGENFMTEIGITPKTFLLRLRQ